MSARANMLAKAPGAATVADAAPGFDHVDDWVFDLDNTLYCASRGLFDQIDQRMGAYLMRLFDTDAETARRIQKDYFHRYGTTLRGLMLNGEIDDPDDFLHFVHDIDYSTITPNPALDAALARIAGRKWVFTNGSVSHAENVLTRLGVIDHIDEIFDIRAADYVPKPHPQAYDAFFERTRIDPAASAMFEDIARNLVEPHARGMVTVLVDHPDNADSRCLCAHGGGAESLDHVHYRTEDLSEFLTDITQAGKEA